MGFLTSLKSLYRKQVLTRTYPNIFDSVVSDPALIDPSATIIKSSLSGQVTVKEGAFISEALLAGKITIGRFSSFNGPNSDIYCLHYPVEIKNFCSIARNVAIQEYNHRFNKITSYFILNHVFGDERKQETTSKGKITLGNDVWIGTQCVILSGVTIGDGAVIGANSVVSEDIAPYAIAVGSPAKAISFRFSPEVITKLLEVQWWEWALERIRRNRSLFENELTPGLLDQIVS